MEDDTDATFSITELSDVKTAIEQIVAGTVTVEAEHRDLVSRTAHMPEAVVIQFIVDHLAPRLPQAVDRMMHAP